jgi:hypothetical protein
LADEEATGGAITSYLDARRLGPPQC